VSPAAAAIVRHCLEPDSARRYPSAAALREDIERHLANLPLRYAAEPSPVERLRKWARRHPRLPLRLSLAAAALLLIAAGAFAWNVQRLDREARAEQERQAFKDDFRHAQFLLGIKPDLRPRQRQEGEKVCRRALGRYGVLDDRRWQKHWRLTALPGDRQRELKGQIGELLLLLDRTTLEEGGQPAQALEYNRLAETCFAEDVPPTLWTQRARLYKEAKQPQEERLAREQADAIGTRTVRDRWLAAREHAHEKRFAKAKQLLEPAVQEEPAHYWAWFLLGVCHDGLGQYDKAITCFTACIALGPDFHGPYANRGQVHLVRKEHEEALADFNRAIQLCPDHPDHYMDRALARWGLRDPKGAIRDLDEALARGIGLTRVYFQRARIRRQTGDEKGAARDEAEGLKLRPRDELSWVARGLFLLQDRHKPREALADFEEALKINPRSQSALMNKANVLADHLKRQTEANRVLDRVLELYPNHVPALSGQAVVQARLKQRDKARKQIALALELHPTGEVLYQAACVYALTSQKEADDEKALGYLRRAIDARWGLRFVEVDTDLAPLRGKDGFRPLLKAARDLVRIEQLLRPAALPTKR
jgi:tetratricopeptide (TPR) repeat protein